MDQFLDQVLKVARTINKYTADYILVILLIAVGLLFTVGTRFVQVRCFGEGMRQSLGNFSLKGGKQKSGLSSFQSLATAIALIALCKLVFDESKRARELRAATKKKSE